MAQILIIDDSLFQRKVISKILQEAGYEYREAQNGKEGLAQIRLEKPDLVLLDLLMPEVDGFSVLQELQKDPAPVPVIVLTSDVQMSTREECMNLGAKDFVNKPVHSEELLPAIMKILSGAP